ncbi:hypothetical protein ACP70R_010840 [Stipagrostis hirtigluma subsp. patula]
MAGQKAGTGCGVSCATWPGLLADLLPCKVQVVEAGNDFSPYHVASCSR